MTADQTQFDRLPQWLRARLRRLDVGEPLETWIQRPIPALKGRSIVQAIAMPGGEADVRLFLGQIEGQQFA